MADGEDAGTTFAGATSVKTIARKLPTAHRPTARSVVRDRVKSVMPGRFPPAVVMATVVSGLMLASGAEHERVVAVFLCYGVIAVAQFFSATRIDANPNRWITVGMPIVMTLAQCFAMAMTGGITSPFFPLLVASGVLVFVVHGRGPDGDWLFVWNMTLPVILACLPESWLGPLPPNPYRTVMLLFSTAFSLGVARRGALRLADAYRETGAARDNLREELFAAVTARAKSLESIGAKVAHELKNPLAAIKGLVQLEARSATDDRSQERLKVMTTELSRMEVILRDYLSFSRPLDDLRVAPTDVTALCMEVAAVLEARAVHAKVALTVSGDDVTVTADPRRLKEAMLNLVANAIEATPPGGAVEVALADDDGGVRIEVKDTGKGMSAEALDRLGTPFYTTRENGTGLGVVLARAVVVQHGGEMKFASDIGRGTMVRVRLPAEPPRDPPKEGAEP